MTQIPCGCGEYGVSFDEEPPESIDVVCPECGNHFGYAGPSPEEGHQDAFGRR